MKSHMRNKYIVLKIFIFLMFFYDVPNCTTTHLIYYTRRGGAFCLRPGDGSAYKGKKIPNLPMHAGNEWEEPISSYIWAGWVQEIAFGSSRLLWKLPILFRGLYGIYLKSMKEIMKITTCDRLGWSWKHHKDLHRLCMPKNLLGHWMRDMWIT